MSKKKRFSGSHPVTLTASFCFLAFLLLAFRDSSSLGFILAFSVPVVLLLEYFFLPRLFSLDRLLISLINFPCALCILLQYVIRPDLAVRLALSYGIGLVLMVFFAGLVRRIQNWRLPALLFSLISLLLLAVPLTLGQEAGGSISGIFADDFSLQFSTLSQIGLIIVLAWCFSNHLPLPGLLIASFFVTLLLLREDLPAALSVLAAALLMFWIAEGSGSLTLICLAGTAAVAWIRWQLYPPIRLQLSLLHDTISAAGTAGGQPLPLFHGGFWGSGLGLNSPPGVSAEASGPAFTVLCSHFGVLFGICVLLIYAAILWRGTAIAMSARRRFHGLLAMGSVIMLGLEVFFSVGCALNLLPLRSPPMPFLSGNGVFLISCMGLSGLIHGVAGLNENDLREDASLAMLERS